jgi:hypothetical protein
MVTGIVGSAGVLINDHSFRIPRTAANLRSHIILTIVAWGKTPFAILKHPAADISWKGFALMLLNCLKQVFGCLVRILRGSMQMSIEMRRGIMKSLLCGLNG